MPNVHCARCCLRYETRLDAASGAVVPRTCPHCGDAAIGIGRTFDEACADAVMRLRHQGQNDVWSVAAHLLYTADVAERSAPDVNLVHMVRLCAEASL